MLLTMPLISGADVYMPAVEPQKDILNIHCDTYKSKAFKLCINLLLNKTFLSIYRSFLDIYVSQGSVATRLRCGGIIESADERILEIAFNS